MKSLREDGRPADLWFWSDWFSSTEVRLCSLAARGLWVDMIGIMSRSPEKGKLLANGKPMSSKELAKFVGEFLDKVDELLVELEYYNVFSRDSNGTIYCRRMVREAELSKKRSDAGRLGGCKAKGKQNESNIPSKSESKRQATLESEDEDDSSSSLKEEALNIWNGFAEKHRLPVIKSIPAGSKRERVLMARLKDGAFDFRALLAEVERSPFLLGNKNGSDFKATFDWVIAPSNCQKIIEGNYRGSTPVDGASAWLKQQEEKDGGE